MKKGIYCITDECTGKKYIGASSNLEKRIHTHKIKLELGTHENYLLQKAFNDSSFSFEIIEEVKDISDLRERENFYIAKFNSFYKDGGFNLSKKSIYPRSIKKRRKRTVPQYSISENHSSSFEIKMNLKAARVQIGIKQKELSFRSKISTYKLSKYENGLYKVPIEERELIANSLNLESKFIEWND